MPTKDSRAIRTTGELVGGPYDGQRREMGLTQKVWKPKGERGAYVRQFVVTRRGTRPRPVHNSDGTAVLWKWYAKD